MRIHDVEKVKLAFRLFLKDNADSVNAQEWVDNPKHIVLENDDGDLALFEPGIKHVYSGHYYFKSRGRKAIEAGKSFLDEFFNTCYNIDVLTGLVPIKHLGARWLSRQLGFSSHGVVDYIDNKHYELFILTKKEFNSHE